MRIVRILLSLLVVVCLTLLMGCGKKDAPSPTVPETALQATSQLKDSLPAEEVKFDYAPGSMGIYVKADPNIEAAPEVLDSITMTLSDKKKELTRVRVSDRQFDFIKDGHQIGGFLLVDIPREILEKEPECWADFETVVNHIATQVMPGIYPSGAHINGGGHIEYGFEMPMCMTFMIEKDGSKDQYIHQIYIGEKYVYDFWHDTCYLADSGETIMTTLSADDIKPELNERTPWSIHDFPDNPWASNN